MKFWLPEQSAGEIVTLDKLDAVAVSSGVAGWMALRGTRRFPALDDSALELLTPNAILVAALADDYEYRSVGHALVEGFNEDFTGRRLSAITAEAPRFGLGLRMLYDMVRAGGEPVGYRGWAGQDMEGARFVYHENAILPFGSGGVVDHILVLSVLVPQDVMPATVRA
ncbi:MAG: hypothetical protein JWP16_2081 [Alphaproteobacteria bacterium]|nr:hypothetical protein [Alphaproteobacteria bacterium]